MRSIVASAFGAAALLAGAAEAAPFTVLGTDAVYGAGLGGNGLSTAPQSFSFAAGAGQTLSFSGVTGLTGCCGGGSGNLDADGGFGTGGGNTAVTSLNGLSGITAPNQMFLAGVFVSSFNLPVDPAPASLDYVSGPSVSDASFLGLLLNQVFFVGDGLTGTGTGATQTFEVPELADTLLLGFVDSFAFVGAPSFYGDNPGSLSGSFTIAGSPDPSPVPLPASLPLLAGALGVAAFAARRRPA